MKPMSDSGPDGERHFVELLQEGTAFKAELTVGMLRAAGIPAYARTEGPVDEFTVTQRAVGVGVGVLVPQDRVEDGQRVMQGLEPLGEPEPDLLSRDAMVEAARAQQRDDSPAGSVVPALILLTVAGVILYLLSTVDFQA